MLHHGHIIPRHSEGYADADTVYAIASCSKAFATATVAKLVDEGKLGWHAPVGTTCLAEFAHTPADPEVGRRATLRDMCSHGTGLAPIGHAAMGARSMCWIDVGIDDAVERSFGMDDVVQSCVCDF